MKKAKYNLIAPLLIIVIGCSISIIIQHLLSSPKNLNKTSGTIFLFICPALIILLIYIHITLIKKYTLLFQEVKSVIHGDIKLFSPWELFRIKGNYQKRKVIVSFRWYNVFSQITLVKMKPLSSFPHKMIVLDYSHSTKNTYLIDGLVEARFNDYTAIIRRNNFLKVLEELRLTCEKIETEEVKIKY